MINFNLSDWTQIGLQNSQTHCTEGELCLATHRWFDLSNSISLFHNVTEHTEAVTLTHFCCFILRWIWQYHSAYVRENHIARTPSISMMAKRHLHRAKLVTSLCQKWSTLLRKCPCCITFGVVMSQIDSTRFDCHTLYSTRQDQKIGFRFLIFEIFEWQGCVDHYWRVSGPGG